MRTETRVTVKVTYTACDPTYHHYAADRWDHPEAANARDLFDSLIADPPPNLVRVELYRELHAYTLTRWLTWEREAAMMEDGQ